MHQHIVLLDAEIALNQAEDWGDDTARVADASARLNRLRACGVDTNTAAMARRSVARSRWLRCWCAISRKASAGTGVRAGILKCATDAPGLTPGVERILRATAKAQRRTGVPISTHTHARRRVSLDQQRIFP